MALSIFRLLVAVLTYSDRLNGACTSSATSFAPTNQKDCIIGMAIFFACLVVTR